MLRPDSRCSLRDRRAGRQRDDEDDTDADGLSNATEQRFGTDPSNADTDDDGFNDGDEVDQRTHPAYSLSFPTAAGLPKAPTHRSLDLALVAAATADLGIKLPIQDRFRNLGTGSFSAEVWIQLGVDTDGLILAGIVDGMTALKVGIENGAPFVSLLQDDGTTVKLGGDEAPVGTIDTGEMAPFANGEWHHVAVTYNSSDNALMLVVDGVLWAESASDIRESGPVEGILTLWMAGDRTGAADTHFDDGYLDEIRIWTLARSRQDFENNRHTWIQEGDENLLAYYRFDDGGDNIEDFRVPIRGNRIGLDYVLDIVPGATDVTDTQFATVYGFDDINNDAISDAFEAMFSDTFDIFDFNLPDIESFQGVPLDQITRQFKIDALSLPSAQGWAFAGADEATTFSAVNGRIVQNTMGQDLGTTATYAEGPVNGAEPFILEFTARIADFERQPVDQNETPDHFGFAVVIDGGAYPGTF